MVYQSPRKVVVEVLKTVIEKRKPLKFVLTEKVLSMFDKSDRAFLLEVVYGVLRNLYYIDWLLDGFYKNREKLSIYTINNLRAAIYQLIFMHIPGYAVTNEAVNIEKSLNGKPKVVNAILRNFLRKYQGNELLLLTEPMQKDNKNLSILYSHPEWLIKRWHKRFNLDELKAFLKANNEKPPFTIAVKPEERQMVAEYFIERGFKVSFSKHVTSGLIIEGQGYDIRKTLKEATFFWIVQDEASQLVCFLLEPFEGARVLDACASPGGKTLLTAALIKKGKIFCVEYNRIRLKILKENLDRVKRFLPHVQIEIILEDICKVNFKDHLGIDEFDRIILDAPCSSTGVIRRNPDIRYRVSEQEIKRLSKNQRVMLDRVSQFLVKKGILVYSVCSTEPEEGEEVIESFLQKHDEFSSIEKLRTYPHIDGMDGFFMAKLLRIK
ncbi:MAG: 16S rRNA (cytosine(967)-C(5))-methyltransferase RsmB [Thermodesulfovibrio sp.]|nr:16S rRNA (cytosine(967)-C(5))-methyltransferase RsmB [Thermodesulfovibrio sp.]